jgi:hypothetical protein
MRYTRTCSRLTLSSIGLALGEVTLLVSHTGLGRASNRVMSFRE